MLIQCLLKRPNGTEIKFGDVNKPLAVYHFKPQDPGNSESPHVCEVTDEAHIARFLSIKEGYQAHGRDAKKVKPELKPLDKAPLGENIGAPLDSNPDIKPDVDPGSDGLETLDVAELLVRVKAKTGREPNPKSSRDKLLAILRAPA